MDARTLPAGIYDPASWGLHHYPAVAAFYVLGIAATAQQRDEFFIKLAETPTWRSPHGRDPIPAVLALHPGRVLDHHQLNALPWATSQSQGGWRYPASHLLRDVLRPALVDVIRPGALTMLFDDMEYRQAALQYIRPKESRENWPYVGEYILRGSWRDDAPDVEKRLQTVLNSGSQAHPRGSAGSALAAASTTRSRSWNCVGSSRRLEASSEFDQRRTAHPGTSQPSVFEPAAIRQVRCYGCVRNRDRTPALNCGNIEGDPGGVDQGRPQAAVSTVPYRTITRPEVLGQSTRYALHRRHLGGSGVTSHGRHAHADSLVPCPRR